MQKKIVVPEGMLSAALKHAGPDYGHWIRAQACLEAALQWLSKNPIVPTNKQLGEMRELPETMFESGLCAEWQRRMFLAPESEVPEEVKDLLYPDFVSAVQMVTGEQCTRTEKRYAESILEAYRRGQESK